MWGKEAREKSLNPHWVSRMRDVAGGVSMERRRWKERIRALRRSDRCSYLISIILIPGML